MRPDRQFTTHRFRHLAYVREGGGAPLLLLHGWPETKRIWWRNIEPLAAAGFEVIVPDLRGFGETGPVPDDEYDTASSSADMAELLAELGHERVVAVGGDFGGVIAQDMSLRFPGLVERLVLFNTIPPVLPDSPAAVPREARQAADYFRRQAREADDLAAELDTPVKRRRYVAEMYGPRFWAAPGCFSREDVDFMTEPFADAAVFRSSIALYEYTVGARRWREKPRLAEPNPTPALILYGPEDHVIPRDFPQRMELAFPDRCGPFVVEGAGHFMQWERAEVLNSALRWFCR